MVKAVLDPMAGLNLHLFLKSPYTDFLVRCKEAIMENRIIEPSEVFSLF